MGWSWRSWQVIAHERITDSDALKLAQAWPEYAKKQRRGKRGLWADEITNETLYGWTMARVMHAANILEKQGLATRCPRLPLYIPLHPFIG